MADDHLSRFKQSLENARAASAPTQDQREREFEETFSGFALLIEQLGDMLEQNQPGSTISYSFVGYHQQDDQLQINIRGQKTGKYTSVLGFVYQGNRLYAMSSDFKRLLGERPPIWTPDQQDDLEPRLADWFRRYFSEP